MRRVLSVVLTLGLLAGAGPAHGDYVVNGGFQTGDFTGWSLSGPGPFVLPGLGYTGDNGAVLSTLGSQVILSQAVTTPTGAPLDLTFFLAGDGSTPNTLQVSFGGNVLLDQTNLPGQGYTAYKFAVTPIPTSSVLEFSFQDDGGFFTLSDVSLTDVASVPEPGSRSLLVLGAILLGGFVRQRPVALAA